ncbi:MAG: hypothetical protein F4Y57_05860, partial [Acidobacteria bacterium]|nr:hypothetical protein [Acidobacteriota bacterium]
ALAAAFSVLQLPVRASFLMGGTAAGAFDPAIVGMVAGSPVGTSLWARLAGLVLLCLVVVERPAVRFAAGLGAVLVCGSFALRGHSLEEPRLVLGGLVTLHLLGLGFWIGIFHPLHRLAGRDAQAAGALAAAFSRRAVCIVPAIAAAGAALFVIMTGDPAAALGTPYGQLLAVKLALFALLLGLAAINKYRLTPALRTGVPRAGAHLRRAIRLEVVAVLAILATTATLTTLFSPGMEDASPRVVHPYAAVNTIWEPSPGPGTADRPPGGRTGSTSVH